MRSLPLTEIQDTNTFYDGLSLPVSARLNLSYSLFNGASFQLDNLDGEAEQAEQIAAMPAVKQIWPVRLYQVPKYTVVQNVSSEVTAATNTVNRRQDVNTTVDTFSPHVMTQVDRLRAAGYTGEGVKLAIVDTGVDYYHPALGGCFGLGCLVSFGYDVVGDNYTGYNTPTPDSDPYDPCEGHGTHVAGIIAAQPNNPYNFTGAAPDVTLGMYRVFGCAGGNAGDDVLIAAFNLAFEDGAQIITASIGGASGWSESPWSVAVQRIVEQGVPCTLAAGNAGEYGLFYGSTAADGKLVTSVASFDNLVYPLLLAEGTYTTDSSNATSSNSTANGTEFGWYPSSPQFGNVTLPLWAVSNTSDNAADACEALPADTPDLSGYIVLIRRGTCTFVSKAQNAAAYGAQYIMFYANTDA